MITSVSVWDLKIWPFLTKNFFNIVEFSIIPLWTTETFSDEWGCAFSVLGIPWVAHLTWPMPILPNIFDLFKFFSNASTLPSHLNSFIFPLCKVAIPDES